MMMVGFWHTAPAFDLPPWVHLNIGWKILVAGIPCYQITLGGGNASAAPVHPFQHFKKWHVDSGNTEEVQFTLASYFQLMEACPGLLDKVWRYEDHT
jgi:hypothetical protein